MLADQMTPEEVEAVVSRYVIPQEMPPWWNWPAVHECYRRLAARSIEMTPTFDAPGEARGIVICAGGPRYFVPAYVCIRMLRSNGCDLPIEVWHLDNEVDEPMKKLLAPFGVVFVNGNDVDRQQRRQCRILNGWELKAFAILNTSFRHVLYLDSDNVPIVNPTFLFGTSQYTTAGAVFWPDYGRLDESRAIWKICDVSYRDEPEFESGQILVDRKQCWRALHLAMHYNEHSDFYYRHIHGDKDTFHMAFAKLGTPYAMPVKPIVPLDCTMCQHDFQGRRIFQHRNLDKWRLDGDNRRIPGFEHEELCREFLLELRQQWDGLVGRDLRGQLLQDRNEVGGRHFHYRRVGYDVRVMEFRHDGQIGQGAARCERRWEIRELEGKKSLVILGDDGPTCHLTKTGDLWRGHWLAYERMPVELTPV